jgi:ubiquinone/menaquinone biosynthesis C-methylase UbiE
MARSSTPMTSRSRLTARDEHSKADAAYHAVRAPSYDRDVTSEYEIYDQLALLPFLDRAGVRGPELTVLDLGCGTGAVTLLLASRGITVQAVDHSPEMIEVAKDKAQRAGLAERIAFHVGDVRDLPFESGRFDGVTCQRVLHHLSDPATVLAEVDRVLKPGGFFYLSDTIPDRTATARVLRLLWRLLRTMLGTMVRTRPRPFPPRQEVHRPVAEVERLLTGAGFSYELRFFTHVGLRRHLSTGQRALVIKALSLPWRRKKGDLLFAFSSKRDTVVTGRAET